MPISYIAMREYADGGHAQWKEWVEGIEGLGPERRKQLIDMGIYLRVLGRVTVDRQRSPWWERWVDLLLLLCINLEETGRLWKECAVQRLCVILKGSALVCAVHSAVPTAISGLQIWRQDIRAEVALARMVDPVRLDALWQLVRVLPCDSDAKHDDEKMSDAIFELYAWLSSMDH